MLIPSAFPTTTLRKAHKQTRALQQELEASGRLNNDDQIILHAIAGRPVSADEFGSAIASAASGLVFRMAISRSQLMSTKPRIARMFGNAVGIAVAVGTPWALYAQRQREARLTLMTFASPAANRLRNTFLEICPYDSTSFAVASVAALQNGPYPLLRGNTTSPRSSDSLDQIQDFEALDVELDTGDPWDRVGQEPPSGRVAREKQLNDDALIRAAGIRAVNHAFTELYEFLTSEDHPGRSLAPSTTPPAGSMEAWLLRFQDISRYQSPLPLSSRASPKATPPQVPTDEASEAADTQDADTLSSTSSDPRPDNAEGSDDEEWRIWEHRSTDQGQARPQSDFEEVEEPKTDMSDSVPRGENGGQWDEEWVADIGGAGDAYTEAYRDTARVVAYPLEGTVNWHAVDAIWQRPELVLTSSFKQRLES